MLTWYKIQAVTNTLHTCDNILKKLAVAIFITWKHSIP